MQIDVKQDREMISALRLKGARGPWLQLLSQVLRLAGSHAELLRHSEKPWTSVTFSGTRHCIALAFSGQEGAHAGEMFIEALPEHEFEIPRQLVADASISSVDQTTAPEMNMTVEIELLLLEDG